MKTTKEVNIIMVKHGEAQKIARAFGVSNAFVTGALKGRQRGKLAMKIRHVAISQYGGVEMITKPDDGLRQAQDALRQAQGDNHQ